MLAVITGGGTGGHVYPAIEVARALEEQGWGLLYLGSLRGQEGEVCRAKGIEFVGFPSEALYSLRTPRGWKSLGLLLRSTAMARQVLRQRIPEVMISTGGYSAGPVMAAARIREVPYVIHESNSMPGRANRMFARRAAGITCSFETTVKLLPGALRTGQPIRRELRDAAAAISLANGSRLVLGLGGSQGSAFLNERLPEAATRLGDSANVLLSTGKANYETVRQRVVDKANVTAKAYLDAEELVKAYSEAALIVARSGGTVAEFAMFGIPSVLIPLPTSADNHQLRNAEEFAAFGGSTLLEQKDASAEALASQIRDWLADLDRVAKARKALKVWDRPDATERIVTIVEQAAGRRPRTLPHA